MKLIKLIILIIVWAAAVLVVSHVNRIYSADKFSVQATDFLKEGEYERALGLINNAVDLNPSEPSYYRTRSLVYLTAGFLEKDVNKRTEDKKNAYTDLQKSLALNPDNLVTERNLVPVYYFLANNNPESAPGAQNHDPEFINAAKDFFRMLKSKYSKDAGVISLVAEYERKLGLTDEYEKSKEMIRSLRPDLLEWYGSFN